MSLVAERIYSGHAYHADKYSISPRALDLVLRNRAEKLSAVIRPDDEVLEFGCGPGWNLINLPAKRRVGHDLNHQFASDLRSHGIEFCPDINRLPDESFSVILLSHVIEHIPDQFTALCDLKRFLKRDGRIIVVVPCEYQKRWRTYSESDKNFHVNAYNVQTLTNLLRMIGYEVHSCKMAPTGYDRFAAEVCASMRGGLWLYRFLLGLLRFMRPEKEIQAVAG